MSLSMSLGSPVVLMDQLLICSRSLGQSGMLLTQAELSRCMRPSVQPAATRVISPLGSNVILRCDATGYPTPTLTWIKTSAFTGKHSRSLSGDEVMLLTSDHQSSHVVIWFSVQIVANKISRRTLTSYPRIWRVVSGAILSLLRFIFTVYMVHVHILLLPVFPLCFFALWCLHPMAKELYGHPHTERCFRHNHVRNINQNQFNKVTQLFYTFQM